MFSIHGSLAWEIFDWLVKLIIMIWSILMIIGYYDILREDKEYCKRKAIIRISVEVFLIGCAFIALYFLLH